MAITDHQSWVLFGELAYLVGIGLLDEYSTVLGIQSKKLVEENPLAAWMQKKLGYSVATFVTIGGFIFSITPLAVHYGKHMLIAIGVGLAAETFNVARNFWELHNDKIKFF